MTTTIEPTKQLLDPKHNFLNKLRHPSVFPHLKEYIEWRRELVYARAHGLPEPLPPRLLPLSINLDLTTACNYYCGHCVDLDVLNSGKNFVTEELFSSLGYLADNGLRSVILIGGGEPTVHPKFREVVRFLKSRGLQVAVVSNGSRTDAICDIADILEGKDWVRFSLDSGTEETFQKMHRPRKPISLGEICAGASRIREKNQTLPIGFSFVIVWDREVGKMQASRERDAVSNIHEMAIATKLARESGFSYISFKAFLNRYPDGGEVMDMEAMADIDRTITTIRTSLADARRFETENFRIVESTNLRVLLDKKWSSFMRQPQVCHMQAFRHVLSPLGIFNCPAKRGVPQARLGNKDAFSGKEKADAAEKSVAEHLDSFNAEKECSHITCLYSLANWRIEEAIRGEIAIDSALTTSEETDMFL
ncbi:MAG: radical SAM protein [bacterium]|nr:radical SAM protein [bacterium]